MSWEDAGGVHRAWQRRLGKEKQINREHVGLYHKKEVTRKGLLNPVPRQLTSEDAAQLEFLKLFHSSSTPSLSRKASEDKRLEAESRSKLAGAKPPLPWTWDLLPTTMLHCHEETAARQLRGAPGSQLREAPGAQLASSALTPGRRPAFDRSSSTPAAPGRGNGRAARLGSELALFDGSLQKSVPPSPALTSISRRSCGTAYWKEVADTVHQEVEKAMKPIREELENEALARQRAEAALLRAESQRKADAQLPMAPGGPQVAMRLSEDFHKQRADVGRPGGAPLKQAGDRTPLLPHGRPPPSASFPHSATAQGRRGQALYE